MVDELLLSRVEDAGINASAPAEQLWIDGWLVRFSRGKAKRSRCVNALARGRLPLDRRLDLVAAVFAEAGLPMVVRITPFTEPPGLDDELARRGFGTLDDTSVMVCQRLPVGARGRDLPADLEWTGLDAARFAAAIGDLRGSPGEQQQAHARRLAQSPVRYHGYAIRRRSDGCVLACGQFAREGELVGLYDVFTHESARGQGWASLLCERLLCQAAAHGAKVAYLQVEAGNTPARRIYQRFGFSDTYAYHYRTAPLGSPAGVS